MKMAFIMNRLERIKAEKDTTYFLMLAAAQRGHEVYYLDQSDLFVEESRVFARTNEVNVHEDLRKPFTVLDEQILGLEEMGAVWIRMDPPFDRTYSYTTLILDLLPPSTRVLNRPEGLRNWNEKLSSLYFKEYGPRTLISQDSDRIRQFMQKIGKITLKPIDGFGGRGIVFLEEGTPNLDQLIEMVTHNGRHRVVAQAYVPEAKDGDKRILLLNGEPLGGILRVHSEGKELNNLDAGGSAHPLELSPRDLEVCAAVKEGLIKQGVLFCGLDILGDKLIELNVTSPTGLQELCRFNRQPFHHQIIEAAEQV